MDKEKLQELKDEFIKLVKDMLSSVNKSKYDIFVQSDDWGAFDQARVVISPRFCGIHYITIAFDQYEIFSDGTCYSGSLRVKWNSLFCTHVFYHHGDLIETLYKIKLYLLDILSKILIEIKKIKNKKVRKIKEDQFSCLITNLENKIYG